jgi:hypothetical protein
MTSTRVLAVAAAATTLALGALPADAARQPTRVITQLTAPATATAGTGVPVTVKVARPGTVRFFVSTDAKASKDDVAVGRARARTRTLRTTVAIPGTVAGSVRLLACSGRTLRDCRASRAATTVTRPADQTVPTDERWRGTLSGQLTFTKTRPLEGTSLTGSRTDTLTVSVQTDVDEYREGWDGFRAGGHYTWQGEGTGVSDSTQCRVEARLLAEGSGSLASVGSQYDDPMLAKFALLDHSELSVLLTSRSTTRSTITETSRTPGGCAKPGTRVEESKGLDQVAVVLKQVGRAGNDVTYAVSAVTSTHGTTSDWQGVTGTLTLTLR